MAIWPFIISARSREELGETVLNHEKIHFRQQLEMLFFFFFVWYFLEYAYQRIRLKNNYQAYRAISFEKEAYHFEQDTDYLQKRKLFSWISFLK